MKYTPGLFFKTIQMQNVMFVFKCGRDVKMGKFSDVVLEKRVAFKGDFSTPFH